MAQSVPGIARDHKTPFHRLIEFANQVVLEENQRVVTLAGKRPGPEEWGLAFRESETELKALADECLLASECTGFTVEEVEKRVNALKTQVLAILLWQRDASSELEAVSTYLVEHIQKMEDACQPVLSLGVRAARVPHSKVQKTPGVALAKKGVKLDVDQVDFAPILAAGEKLLVELRRFSGWRKDCPADYTTRFLYFRRWEPFRAFWDALVAAGLTAIDPNFDAGRDWNYSDDQSLAAAMCLRGLDESLRTEDNDKDDHEAFSRRLGIALELVRDVVAENTDAAAEALSYRQYNILEALFRANAFDAEKRMTTAEVARRAEGVEANPEVFKQPIADLKRRGLLGSKEGRGGGVWLSTSGVALIKQARKL